MMVVLRMTMIPSWTNNFYLRKGIELGGTIIILKVALLPAVIAITYDDTNCAIKAGPTAFEEAKKHLCVNHPLVRSLSNPMSEPQN
eukprot:15353563-Ditylum_brightwellii.AAC.1